MKNEGTIVQVRNIHKNNLEHKKKFIGCLKIAFEATVALLSSYSYILYDKNLAVTEALKAEDVSVGTVKEIWRSTNIGEFFENIKNVLKIQFRNTFPNMTESII